VLDPELASSGGGDRFLREIAIAARLKHPHILSLIDSGEAGGFYYFVMPYVEGESLRDRLERERQLPIEDAIEIAREVADGLGYAHRQGVVHRDIKPANVLLSEGHALIADFGVARALEEEGQGLTRTGMAVGTPQYMSPEQASGTEEVDGRTDLYALGCVLYEMLAGAPPLVGPTAQATAGLRLTETATSLPVLRDTVPGGLDRVTRKLLAKTPADRYPTAEKLAKALASPAVWSSAKRERRVGRRLIDAVIAVVLLALGGYATTWFAGRESEEIHGRARRSPATSGRSTSTGESRTGWRTPRRWSVCGKRRAERLIGACRCARPSRLAAMSRQWAPSPATSVRQTTAWF
jgi:serine/threonine-protein kinase